MPDTMIARLAMGKEKTIISICRRFCDCPSDCQLNSIKLSDATKNSPSNPVLQPQMTMKEQLAQPMKLLLGSNLDSPAGFWIGSQCQTGKGSVIQCQSPIDQTSIGTVQQCHSSQLTEAMNAAQQAFRHWRSVPAPKRGELVRAFGEQLRAHKKDLAMIVSWECGKIYQEALGEVQEMIDICEFAVGLSRQLYGLTIASERPGHRLAEQWHPLGPVGCISAFNFPVAVWAWNAAVAWVCGNPVIWKPSEKTPLTAIACQAIAAKVIDAMEIPQGVSCLVVGDQNIGKQLAESNQLPLISATGSVPMGRHVAQSVAKRLGRSLLELGGNNAAIVSQSADLDLAIRGIVFSAVGTCGQRCTTLRRLIVHQSIYNQLIARLKTSYSSLPIGNPTSATTLVGPLIDGDAFDAMQTALTSATEQGGTVFGGERVQPEKGLSGGYYVRPAIVEIPPSAKILKTEVFAPILYVMSYSQLEEAIEIQNDVPQGLSSAIFTSNVQEAERFCSAAGSDCGIANVNIGTSGAEIGGAFGGEKETGGGRESGSDAWKSYMRRATNTINYSDELPLAQGIVFE
ncbi:MAG: aldehyde dehydrogenase family protein [Planctomycetota bacterium]|nr:aldehyde dehydrogenase family protein [Planctomycetota bacterium]